MSLPTSGDTYEVLNFHLRKAQEAAAMLMMISQAEGDGPGKVLGIGWFHVSEALKKMTHQVTMLATKGSFH
jgi:hypothetical protein